MMADEVIIGTKVEAIIDDGESVDSWLVGTLVEAEDDDVDSDVVLDV